QREAAALAVDGELARGERHVATVSVASLPDGEANQLEAIQLAAGEVHLGVGEFPGWDVAIVRQDADGGANCTLHGSSPCEGRLSGRCGGSTGTSDVGISDARRLQALP